MSKEEWVFKFGEVIKALEQKKVRRRAEIFARATAEATVEWEKEGILIQAEIDGLASQRDELLHDIRSGYLCSECHDTKYINRVVSSSDWELHPVYEVAICLNCKEV